MTCTRESGTCARCQGYCRHKPGWFLPGEAEKAAELLGMPLKRFFYRYLAVDWWENGSGPDTFLLSPAVISSPAGTEMPAEPLGTCVFFQGGRCRIHDAKPAECRDALCTEAADDNGIHRRIAEAWHSDKAQRQITGLLGREPRSKPYDAISFLSSLRHMP